MITKNNKYKIGWQEIEGRNGEREYKLRENYGEVRIIEHYESNRRLITMEMKFDSGSTIRQTYDPIRDKLKYRVTIQHAVLLENKVKEKIRRSKDELPKEFKGGAIALLNKLQRKIEALVEKGG